MFHAETKILSLPLKGSTGRSTTMDATGSDACGGTSGGCYVQIVFVHLFLQLLSALLQI